jgi:hypothetical protein
VTTRAIPSPRAIGEEIADVAAMIDSPERTAIIQVAARAIRAERRGAVRLTQAEALAALRAISEMTDGNAHSFDEWRLATHRSYAEWKSLLRAEEKIKAIALARRS